MLRRDVPDVQQHGHDLCSFAVPRPFNTVYFPPLLVSLTIISYFIEISLIQRSSPLPLFLGVPSQRLLLDSVILFSVVLFISLSLQLHPTALFIRIVKVATMLLIVAGISIMGCAASL